MSSNTATAPAPLTMSVEEAGRRLLAPTAHLQPVPGLTDHQDGGRLPGRRRRPARGKKPRRTQPTDGSPEPILKPPPRCRSIWPANASAVDAEVRVRSRRGREAGHREAAHLFQQGPLCCHLR
jgi:hypothetical protein